jgi:hypothetical protein
MPNTNDIEFAETHSRASLPDPIYSFQDKAGITSTCRGKTIFGRKFLSKTEIQE